MPKLLCKAKAVPVSEVAAKTAPVDELNTPMEDKPRRGRRKKVEEAANCVRVQKDFRLLALDPALRHTGFVVFDERGSVLDYGTIDNPKTKEERLKLAEYNAVVSEITKKVQGFLNHNQDYCVVREDYAYAAGSSSDTLLKELGGIIEWELSKFPSEHAQLHWLNIAAVKKWACGVGNAEKEQVAEGVKANFQFEGDEHQCDAFAVGSLALELIFPGTFAKISSKQKEVLTGYKDHPLTLFKRGYYLLRPRSGYAYDAAGDISE